MVLDRRFWLMWLVSVWAAFFSMDVHMGGVLSRHVLKVAFYGLLFFYLCYFVLDFLPVKLENGLKNVLLILSLSFAFLDFFTSHCFSMGFNQALIETILATNRSEIHAFLVGVLLPHIGVLVGFLLFCGLFLFLMRFKISLKCRQAGLVFALFLGGITAHSIRTGYNLQQGPSGYVVNLIIASHLTPILKETTAILDTIHNRAQAKRIYTNFNQPYPKDYLGVDKDSVPNVVLIIGESASRDFMGIYGYSVPNTPFLSGLLREREREKAILLTPTLLAKPNINQPVPPPSNLFVFPNVIAPFGSTMAVFQVLLNYGDAENHNTPWYQQKNIGSIFNLAGYATFWLDNQEEPGASNAYSLTAHHFDHLFYTPISFKKLYDGALIDTFNDKVKPKLQTRNFILFHFIGSHLLYKER
ncbi:sulfatase-like hydrolase/transferase, partial [Helicobacter heilmannii]|uniref:sulfatase-like hydrolase/transferase n=1 Tax=Helicobacter heilmannii TaxID=35817 RepID=UPI001FFB11B7